MSRPSHSVLLERMLNRLSHSKLSQLDIWQAHHKVIGDIRLGKILIPHLQENFDHHINHNIKEEALKKIFNSDDYYNYEKDEKILLGLPIPQESEKRDRRQFLREEQSLRKKKSEQQIKKEFLQKMKKWQQQKIKITKRKRQAQMKKQMIKNNSEEKRKKDEKDIQAFLKLQKKKVIQARIQQIQNRKYEREQILQQSSVKRSKSVPKYIEYENQFKNRELKKNLQQKIFMENRKASLDMDIEKIKEHEKAYIDRIKKRLNIKSLNNNKSHQSLGKVDDFSLIKKDEKEMKKIQQKIKRIKKFQSKLRLMPLKIDGQKRRERQIIQDKLKNPKKYHFLSQKALSDEQIFDNFKQFDINIDNRDIGNNYMQEMVEKNKVLKKKVSSQKVFPVYKPEYKNYLQEMRVNKKNIQNPDQFDSYAKKLKNYKYQEHGKQFLKQKSDIYEKKTIQNIIELQQLEKYPDSIRKQEEIDDNYAKALKAKIALAKLN